MEKNLFEHSYNINSFREKKFDPLWNKRGIFTSIPVIGKKPYLIGFDKYLRTLNLSLKANSIEFQLNKKNLNKLLDSKLKSIKRFNHLLRIAINQNTISISMRNKRKNHENYFGVFREYQRSNFEHKNLKYKKILNFISGIDNTKQEILLHKNNMILEGALTNLLFIRENKIYSPLNGFYFGNTLKLIQQRLDQKIIFKKIYLENLNDFSEIITLGSGKGVCSLKKIARPLWKRSSKIYYKKLQSLYKEIIITEFYEIQ